jgi:hypothetical protein
MNILEALFTKPRIHSVPRFHAATKRESAAAEAKRDQLHLELGCYVANTTAEQRRAEAEAYFAVARSMRPSRS